MALAARRGKRISCMTITRAVRVAGATEHDRISQPDPVMLQAFVFASTFIGSEGSI
jgi:hypothetical protein